MSKYWFTGFSVNSISWQFQLLADETESVDWGSSDVVLLVFGIFCDGINNIKPLSSGKLDEGDLSDIIGSTSHDLQIFWAEWEQ